MLIYAAAVYVIARTLLHLLTIGVLSLGKFEASVMHVLLVLGGMSSLWAYDWSADKALAIGALAELMYGLRVLLDLGMDWCKLSILSGQRRRPR